MIQVKNITKTYKVKQKQSFFSDLFRPTFRKIDAAKNISFEIAEGELVGFIGPNGAGKTTTIKMLTGIMWPSKGEITVGDFVPYKERKKYLRNVGVVFGQRRSSWPELSVKDNLELIGSFYKLRPKDISDRIKELAELIDLGEFLNQPFRKLSLGQQMKTELVMALLHKPKLLFLDEPTIGMDIIAKADFLQLLKKLNKKEKVTVLLTSHDLNEIERLCKRIIVINKGQILYDGNISKIRPKSVIVQYEESGKFKQRKVLKTKLKSFLNNIDLSDVSITEPPLEEFVKRFYK